MYVLTLHHISGRDLAEAFPSFPKFIDMPKEWKTPEIARVWPSMEASVGASKEKNTCTADTKEGRFTTMIFPDLVVSKFGPPPTVLPTGAPFAQRPNPVNVAAASVVTPAQSVSAQHPSGQTV